MTATHRPPPYCTATCHVIPAEIARSVRGKSELEAATLTQGSPLVSREANPLPRMKLAPN
jgi:hypothetical protein